MKKPTITFEERVIRSAALARQNAEYEAAERSRRANPYPAITQGPTPMISPELRLECLKLAIGSGASDQVQNRAEQFAAFLEPTPRTTVTRASVQKGDPDDTSYGPFPWSRPAFQQQSLSPQLGASETDIRDRYRDHLNLTADLLRTVADMIMDHEIDPHYRERIEQIIARMRASVRGEP